MTWGDRTFTDITLHEIQNMTADQGEVTVGVCGTLNDKGKAPFLNRWRSVMLTHHCLAHLTKWGRQTIKTHVNSYEYFKANTVETSYDGPTVLALILRTMHSTVRVNLFREISSMKYVTLASCNNNVVDWISKMEMNRINIELKIPVAYDDNQFLMDIYQGALKAKCKTFTTEVQSMKQKWLLGTLPNPGRIDTTHAVTQLYSNLVEDGTLKKEFTDTYQIVALTTLVSQMKASIFQEQHCSYNSD